MSFSQIAMSIFNRLLIIICHELLVYYVDLRRVLEAGTYKLAAEWEQLGLALGIEKFRLRQISINNRGDAIACLSDALQTWIDTGSATLEKLVEAVANPAFINNEKLSKEIKEEYLKSDK